MNAFLTCTLLLLAQAKGPVGVAEPLADYFRIETERIASDPLKGITTAEQWAARRPELQRQFKEMLGLDPEPPRGPLSAKIHATLEQPDFVVEKLTYESLPGLIVTGNLYRPKRVDKPLPAILYLCGHSQNEKDGVVLGAKAHYQHHAAWYASNGYVCLIVDTLQLGELPGLHHGTSRAGLWWWQTRGYSPAGVEAWNAVRGVDYLLTRPEVDKERLGVTGRSGGGATSWWVAAIEDRIKVAIPVAGITDLTDHVVDGVVQGHCDCMYHINTYRWDFNLVAALAAPKALLVENTDSDPIFPEDGVRRIYKTLEQVYSWQGASNRLSLVIGRGGHIDSEEIRHPSFAFMNKWLKGTESKVEEPNRKIPEADLRVLNPSNEPPSKNASISEDFIMPASSAPVFSTEEEWTRNRQGWLNELKAKVLAGWPTDKDAGDVGLKLITSSTNEGFLLGSYEYTSQPGIRLALWSIRRPVEAGPRRVCLVVADESSWKSTWSFVAEATRGKGRLTAGNGSPAWQQARAEILSGATLVIVAPRGIGPSAWPTEKDTQIRRRFALLGQTLDGMRAFDVLRAARLLDQIAPGLPAEGMAEGNAAMWLLMCSVMDPTLKQIRLLEPSTSYRQAPAFLNLGRIIELPNLVAMSQADRVRIETSTPAAFSWPLALQDRLSLSRRVEVIRKP